MAWAGSLAWLIGREPSSRQDTPARPEVAQVSPAAAYYRIRLRDSLAGFATFTVDTNARGIEVVELLDVRVPDGDGLRHIFQRSVSRYTRRFGFLSLDQVRRDGPARWLVSAERMNDSLFQWRVTRGTRATTDTIQVRRPATAMTSLAVYALRSRPLRVGESRTVVAVDPLRRGTATVEVTIDRDSSFVVPDSAAFDSTSQRWVAARWDTVRALHLTRRGDGPPVQTWVDEDGVPVAGEVLPGLQVERVPYEMATSEYRYAINAKFPGLGGRVASRIATAAPPPLAEQRLLIPALARDTSGWRKSGIAGGTQSLFLDTLAITRISTAMTGGSSAPTGSSSALTGASSALSGSSSALTAAARQLVGTESDQRKAAERLLSWVHNQVAATPDTGPVDAREAWRERRAGPSSRAALYVALARAAGLESRPVSGLVAVRGGGWARHAWAEVKLEDWVPVDPTFGTFPAGAGYVRLLPGAPADPLYLVPLAASLDPASLSSQRTR